MRHVLAAGEAVEEAGGEEIAGAGGIDHLCNRRGRHRDAIFGGDHHRAFLAPRQHRDSASPRTAAAAFSKSWVS